MSVGKSKMADQLVATIDDLSNQEIEDQAESNQSYKDREIKQYTDKVNEDCKIFIRDELHDLKVQLQSSHAAEKWNIKKSMFVKRNEMIDDLFREVERKLMNFTKTAAYNDYLQACRARLIAQNLLEDATITVRRADVEVVMTLFKADLVTVIGAETVHIGGLICDQKSRGIEADLSLDYRLKQQMQWFYNHSQLII